MAQLPPAKARSYMRWILSSPSSLTPSKVRRNRACPAIVENLVAMALFRACEADLVEAFRLPQAICFWRSSRDREIDFLAGPRPHQVPVEVKYQNHVGAQDTLTIRNALGRGMVLSRHDVELGGPVSIVPVAAFLATLQH